MGDLLSSDGLLGSFLEVVSKITESEFPLTRVIAFVVLLMLVFLLKNLMTELLVKRIERFTAKTTMTWDDDLAATIRGPLGLLVVLGGLYFSYMPVAEFFEVSLRGKIEQVFGFLTIAFCGLLVYRIAPAVQIFAQDLASRTTTELDDIFARYTTTFIRTAVTIVVAIKGSEILLGSSSGILIGLLGGAGVAVGLVVKDMIYDWCCTVIVYLDRVYRPGDWISVSGLSGFVQVQEIGLRTTKLFVSYWGSIVKIPNSKMISGIVENWSQNRGKQLEWGIVLNLKVDLISAAQTKRIYAGLRQLAENVEGAVGFFVRLASIEGNARVFVIQCYAIDENLYYDIEYALNVGILEILEREGIHSLQVELQAESESYQKMLREAARN